jgi:D-beta-D-heptose 7-phosphate kinase/D-beta-D-heptose 1-phosphate adenosyltransferase
MFSDPDRVRRLVANRFSGARVLVLGDLMLDCHIRGEVTRISPEAPVPVVRVVSRSWSPGGAANVATNLSELGLQVELLGALGADDAGGRLRELLRARGIAADGAVADPAFATIVKTRVIGGHHQMLRIDDERPGALNGATVAALIARVEERLAGLGALVISDYAKGVCAPALCAAVISAARARGIPVLVDPKGRDFAKYAGATTITPNTGELAQASGADAGDHQRLVEGGRELRRRLGLGFLTFTRGEHGIALIEGDAVHEIPATAREVFDVSGAGDTVIAVLAACLAGHDAALSPLDAVRLANLAGGIVVGKVGTVSVHLDELLASLDADLGGAGGGKVLTVGEAQARLARWRAQGERVVFTNGCFDLLHAGHVALLEQARQAGDRLVVGLNSDTSVRALKGASRPLNHQADRASVLSGLAAVDAVVVFGEETPLALIRALRPEVLVKGADYREDQVVGGSEVRSWGGRVVLVPLLDGRSTTAAIARLRR